MSVIKPALEHPELIAYFAGANNYCWLHFRNGEKKLLAKPISYLENKLPNFIRAHKTVLINPACVKSLNRPPRQKMAGEILLDSGEVFPVSRRRWGQVAESLQDYLLSVGCEDMLNDAFEAADSFPTENTLQEEPAMHSILLITDDGQAALLARQLIEKKWPENQLHTSQQSNHLADTLRPLPHQAHPILILLDARTTTQERFQTLKKLKEDPKTSRIPVVLLVSNSNQSIVKAYEQKANSVIALSDQYMSFIQVIERVCQFWLSTVTLPLVPLSAI